MSSHTRQRLLLYQVECRVALDSAFRPSRSNVESHDWVSDLMVERRVILDSAFRYSKTKLESYSKAIIVPGRMSSHCRQRFLLFLVECQFPLDSAFCCSRSNVESHSTMLLLFQVKCRVTVDRAFRPSRSSVDSQSTALSYVSRHSTSKGVKR